MLTAWLVCVGAAVVLGYGVMDAPAWGLRALLILISVVGFGALGMLWRSLAGGAP